MTCNVYRVDTVGGVEKSLQEKIEYVVDVAKVSIKRTNVEKLYFLTNPEWRKEFVWDGLNSDDEFHFTASYHCTRDDFIDYCLYLKNFYLGAHHRSVDNGPVAWHVVISWPENALVSNEDVFRMSCEIVKECGPYPAILGAHIKPVFDEKRHVLRGVCKHCHILFSAYPDQFDHMPHKLNFGRNNIKIRAICDRIAVLNGQEIIVKADLKRSQSYSLAIQARMGTSWVKSLASIAEAAAKKANNMDDYKKILRNSGIEIFIDEAGLLRYKDKEGNEITATRLGRAYTKESLELRWDDRLGLSPRTSGNVLTEYEKETDLNVSIPLGGIPSSNATEYIQFPLKGRCWKIPEEVLQSYFISGHAYEVLDENGKTLILVDGRQVLDFLGAIPLDVVQRKGETPNESFEQLQLKKKRIHHQNRKNYNEQSDSIRCKQNFLTRERARRKENKYRGERYTVSYDSNRRPDGSKRTPVEWLLLLLLSICIADFNINKYSYKLPPEKRNLKSEREIQRACDLIEFMESENIPSFLELIAMSKEATKQYWTMVNKLAAIELELSNQLRAKDAIEIYFEVGSKLRKIMLEENLTPDQLRKKYADECRDFDLSITIFREYAIGNWNNVIDTMNRYEYLKSAQVELKMAVSAQFERHEKLRLARKDAEILVYRNVLKRDGERPPLETIERFSQSHNDDERSQSNTPEPLFPSFDDMLSDADQRKSEGNPRNINSIKKDKEDR